MTAGRVFKPLPVSPPPPTDPWHTLEVADLARELPPVPWLCEPLRLAPGAVTMFAGYGYSRKTLALQSLALSVAAGRPVWGLYSVKKGRVVHLDYEQGTRPTTERYQRMARGMGFEISELESGALRVCVLPEKYLDEQGIFDQLIPLCAGASLIVVDSFRAAFPGVDENSSESRRYLDALSRVSESTGAMTAVVHHARKSPAGESDDASQSLRGSSSFFDACQSVFVFHGAKDGPTLVNHQKERLQGLTVEDFGLTSEDITGPSGPRDGLRVRHLDLEEMAASQDAAETRKRAASRAKGMSAIESYFAKNAGAVCLGVKAIRAQVGIKGQTFDEAWAELTRLRRLHRDGKHPHYTWSLSGGSISG